MHSSSCHLRFEVTISKSNPRDWLTLLEDMMKKDCVDLSNTEQVAQLLQRQKVFVTFCPRSSEGKKTYWPIDVEFLRKLIEDMKFHVPTLLYHFHLCVWLIALHSLHICHTDKLSISRFFCDWFISCHGAFWKYPKSQRNIRCCRIYQKNISPKHPRFCSPFDPL